MNRKLLHVQAGFRKGRGIRDQIANIHWIIEKQGNSRKTSTSASLTTLKPLCASQLWVILKEMEILDHFTCFLYVGQEITERDGEMRWFKIGKSTSRLFVFTLLV